MGFVGVFVVSSFHYYFVGALVFWSFVVFGILIKYLYLRRNDFHFLCFCKNVLMFD